MNDDVQQVKVA